MKKVIIITAMIFAALTMKAQNAKVNASGNYEAVKTEQAKGKATGKTFTDNKGNVYAVYESKNGKLYYNRVSKTGNEYKVYLKLN